ncbi:MAG: hypothetical protein E7638_03845 [Ruminococcaceae bacterium]|nr:hypothetical protein [Oscillospiraceae bacterium]
MASKYQSSIDAVKKEMAERREARNKQYASEFNNTSQTGKSADGTAPEKFKAYDLEVRARRLFGMGTGQTPKSRDTVAENLNKGYSAPNRPKRQPVVEETVKAASPKSAYERMQDVPKNSAARAALRGVDRMTAAPAANSFEKQLSDLNGQLENIKKQKNEILRESEEAKTIKGLQSKKSAVQLARQKAMMSGRPYDFSEGELDLNKQISEAQALLDAKISPYNEEIERVESEIMSAYASLMDADDFADRSKYVSTEKTDEEKSWNEKFGINPPPAFKDVRYDYINRNKDAVELYENYEISETNRKAMSDDEIKIFNYLYSSNGSDSAYAFVDFIEKDLNIRQRTAQEEEAAKFADEHKILASGASLGANLLKPGVALAQAVDYAVNGEIDQNAGYNAPVYVSSVYRQTVGDKIKENWGPVGSFAYNMGMSMADFLMNTAISGGNPYIATSLMGTQTMADTVLSARDRGLSSDQAMTLGVIAAGAEMLTEKFSLDALFDKKGWAKSGLKYILRNAFTEGTEEVGSGLINTFADILVSKDQSEWRQSIAYYMSEEGGGLSEEEAFNKAMLDQAKSLGLDFLSGAISGGVMGAGGAVTYSVTTPGSVKREIAVSSALDAVISADRKTEIKAAAKLVDTVAKYKDKNTNAVNATLDDIRERLRDMDTVFRELDNADVSTKEKAAEVNKIRDELVEQRKKLREAYEMIRTRHSDIEALRRKKETNEYEEVGELEKSENIPGSDIKLSRDVEDYSPEHQKVIEEYANAVDDNFRRFIDSVIDNPGHRDDSYSLSVVSEDTARKIKDIIGFDTEGWNTKIESRMIRHIWNRHGADGQQDNSMANRDDIARIQYVIDNADSIEQSGTSSAYKEPHPYLTGKMKSAKTITYSKKVNGTYYVVEAVPDTAKRTNYIISAYMTKNKEASIADDTEVSPRVTSTSRSNAPGDGFGFSDTIISQSGERVNGDSSRIFDSDAVSQAYAEAEIDIDRAAKKLRNAYGGRAREAVVSLRLTKAAVDQSNLPEATKREMRSRLRGLEESLYRNNASYIEEKAAVLRTSLARFGIRNVVVDPGLAAYGKETSSGNYSAKDKTIHLSPYLSTDQAVMSVVVHELLHNAAKADKTLVKDVLAIMRQEAAGLHLAVKAEDYVAAYREPLADYLKSDEGKAAIADYAAQGMTEEAARQAATNDYINEEMAAHFLQALADERNLDAARELLRENRSLFRRILDKIGEIIRRLGRGNPEARPYMEASRFLRSLMEEGTGVKTKAGKIEVPADANKDSRLSVDVVGGTRVVFVSQSEIDNLMKSKGESLPAKVRSYLSNKFRGVVLPVGETDKAFIRREGTNEFTNPAKRLDETTYQSKMYAASEFDELLSASTFVSHSSDDGRHPDAVRGWNTYKTSFVVPNAEGGFEAFEGDVKIKLIQRGDCFYDITNIKNITNSTAGQAFVKAAGSVDDVSNNSIADSSGDVKGDGENSDVRYSKDVDAITSKEIEMIESHFGTTKNFDVAGYLMTDGKMLDFSGRHWGGGSSEMRTVDHRDVLEAFDYKGIHSENNGIKAMVDMIGSGNIRLAPESGGINLAVKPNEEQLKVLREYIRHFNGEVIVDVDAVGGDTIHTFTYNKGTAPMTVIRDIMEYFEEGTVPKEQPEYRQFRYSKDVWNTSTGKIRPEMSDDERYEILKNRTIALTAETDYQRLAEFDGDLDGIETLKDTQKKKLLRKIGEQFGVVKRYENADIALEFSYSYDNLKNSVHKQKKNYGDFAKMLSCFDDVVENAVGVEVHNRNGKYKTDSALKNMYVLVGAFRDGDSIVPVKLEVKEFNDSNINNTLYVSVALEAIEKDRIETAPSLDENQNYAAPLSTISIADLFANVNTSDGSFLKYIPDGFLDDAQRSAKAKYIADESERIEREGVRYSRDVTDTRTTEGDFTYQSLVSKPDMKIVEMFLPESYNGETRPPRQSVVKAAIDNAKSKKHPKNNYTTTYVRNKDTGNDILVGAKSITHGLNRKYENNAVASAYIGDLIENAILINEHESRDGGTEGKIYLSAGRYRGELFLCRIITNEDNSAESIEVMYALNAKKEPVAHYRLDSAESLLPVNTDSSQESDAKYRYDSAERLPLDETDSTISIADFLNFVKTYFADVLPEDVLNTMNMTRPKSTVSDSVKYSRDVTDTRTTEGDFTYQSLVSKPDMVIPYLSTPQTFSNGNMTRSDVKAEAIKNARGKNNPKNSDDNVYVRNKDTETDILVGSSGLNHGLNRSYQKVAVATANIGNLIENAVLINKHEARDGNEDGSVYLSVGHDGTDLYVCRIITNNNHALLDVEVLSALNAKKESAAHYRLGSGVELRPYTDSTISIADFLNIVKTYFADVLPEDVLNTMNMTRPKSTVSDSVKYSRDVTDTRTTEEKLREENEYLKRQFVGKLGSAGAGWTNALNEEVLGNVGRAVAKHLPNVASSQVISELREVKKILQRDITEDYTEEQRYNDARDAAMKAAENLIDKARLTSVSDEWLDIRDLKKKLRETKVYVSEDIRSEFAEWQEIRRELSGALSITTTDNSAVGVDTFYDELAGEYPEFFSPDITIPQQQMERIIEVARELKGIKKFKYESLWVDESDSMDASRADAENNAAVESFANGILGEYVNAAAKEVLKRIKYRNTAVNKQVGEAKLMYKNIAREMTRDAEAAENEAYRILRKINHGKEVADIAGARKRNLSLLNHLYGYLTKPTNKNHVPVELQKSVARLLELFSGEKLTGGKVIDREKLRKVSASGRTVNTDEVVRLLENINRVAEKNKDKAAFAVSPEFIAELKAKIENAKEIFAEANSVLGVENFEEAGKNYYIQNELAFLREVNDILSMVKNYIDNANKVFIDGKAESAADMASELKNDLRMRPMKRELGGGKYTGTSSKPSRVVLEHMKADTYFHLMGSVGDRIIKAFRNAQNAQLSHEADYSRFVKKRLEESEGYDTHHTGWGGDVVTITVDGKSFDVTKGQLMQLYVTWERPAGRQHITTGGVFFASRGGEQLSDRHVVFTEDSFANVMKQLPSEDKAMAEKIARYLSTRCAQWGNAASMRLYGYQKFLDDNYFPILTASSENKKNWNKTDDYSTLENLGMTKSLKEGAKNSVVMVDFFDVADKHVRDMAAYAAYAPLNNDLTRVFDIEGVQQTVKDVLGEAAWEYFVDFQADVNNNKRQGLENGYALQWVNTFTNLYKRQAVSFNTSTVVKQYLSYIRAWNSIEAKYLAAAFKDKSMLPGGESYNRILADMTEYSGVAMMKMLGYSDIGVGKSLRSVYDDSYSALGDEFRNRFVRGAVKTHENFTEAGMWLAGKADEMTWVRLWKACELEVDAAHKGLNGDARMKAVAERFNQVIGETQVVDTILDTAPVMKFKNPFTRTVYAFMNEPIATMNTIYRAFDDVRLGKKGAGIELTKALGIFAVTNLILEPLISALFTMLRDEEEEEGVFLEKLGNLMFGIPRSGEDASFTGVMTSNVVSGFFSNIPIVEEIYDVCTNTIQNYDVERMEVSAFAKVIGSVVSLWRYNPDKTNKSYTNTILDVVSAFASFTGIPFNTFKRDVLAGIRLVMQCADLHGAEWALNKLLYNLNSGAAREQKGFYDILSRAAEAGDEEAYRYMRKDLQSIIKTSSRGLTSTDIIEAVEKRGGKIAVGSKIWNVELQANFNLPSFNSNMRVENLITSVYKRNKKGGEYDKDVLPKTPENEYTIKVEVRNDEGKLEKVSKSVKFKTEADYIKFTEDVGYFSYMVLQSFAGTTYSDSFNRLTPTQQSYAIRQAYKYARSKYLKEYDDRYDSFSGWQQDMYSRNYSADRVAQVILRKAGDQ